jgi:hypothetical protein
MALDETSVRVRVITIGGALVGRMSKGKGVRLLDALNLKGDFVALTEIEDDKGSPVKGRFIALNKSQIVSVEEMPLSSLPSS